MADSCMAALTRLTKREQAEITDWVLRSVAERPADFTVEDHTLSDRKTGVSLWVSNGRFGVQLWRPNHSARFKFRYGRKIFNVAHAIRHRRGTPLVQEMRRVMGLTPASGSPVISIPRDEFDRTSAEVSKLRAMVRATMRSPVTVGVAIVFFCVVCGVTGYAMAG